MLPSKILSLFLCFCLILEQGVFAQTIDLSHYFARNPTQPIPQSDKFRPVHLRYISYDSQANDFKLLLDKGDFFNQQTPKLSNSPNSSTPKLEEATQELMKYFFIGLSLPNEKFWVNLRPDSPDNILDPDLEKTDIGRIFLEADLQLKKDTSGMTSPQTKEGREYWDKLYKKAGELFGSENITIPTITRPWIVPNEIIIREAPDNAYIYKATLKVMLEEDYLKSSQQYVFNDPRLKELNQYSTQLIKETIIPKLTYAVNTSKRYAQLRQVYYSLILAQWFKQKYGDSGSIRAAGISAPVNSYIDLIDSGNLVNLTSSQPYDKQAYFYQYQKSFKDGEYNLQEPAYTPMGQSIRRYMSGGLKLWDMNTAVISIKSVGSPVLGNKQFLKWFRYRDKQLYAEVKEELRSLKEYNIDDIVRKIKIIRKIVPSFEYYLVDKGVYSGGYTEEDPLSALCSSWKKYNISEEQFQQLLKHFNPDLAEEFVNVGSIMKMFGYPSYLLRIMFDSRLNPVFKKSKGDIEKFIVAVLEEINYSSFRFSMIMKYLDNYHRVSIPFLRSLKNVEELPHLERYNSIYFNDIDMFISVFNPDIIPFLKIVKDLLRKLPQEDPQGYNFNVFKSIVKGELNDIFKKVENNDMEKFREEVVRSGKNITSLSDIRMKYLATPSRRILNIVKLDDSILDEYIEFLRYRDSVFVDNVEMFLEVFNLDMLGVSHHIRKIKERRFKVPIGEIIRFILRGEYNDDVKTLVVFLSQELNETVLEEKSELFRMCMRPGGPGLPAFVLIVKFLKTGVNHDNMLSVIRGMNNILRNDGIKKSDTEEDIKLLLGDYVKRFGFLANRDIIVVHRNLLKNKDPDSPELSEYRLRELGISQTGESGLLQIENILKEIKRKIVEQRDVPSEYLANTLIAAFVGGITGYYTSDISNLMQLSIRDFVEEFNLNERERPVSSLDPAFAQEGNFFVHRKGKAEFTIDAKNKFNSYVALINQALDMSDKSAVDQINEFKKMAIDLIDLRSAELKRKIGANQSIQNDKIASNIEMQIIRLSKFRDGIISYDQNVLFDLAKMMVNAKELENVVALLLIVVTFSNDEHNAFKKNLKESINDGLSYISVSHLIELKEVVIKDHVLKNMEAATSKLLLRTLHVRIFQEELSRIKAGEEKMEVNVFATKGVLGEMAGYIGNACYTRVSNITHKEELVPLIFTVGKDFSTELIGSALILKNSVDGQPVFILRAINPSVKFLSDYDAEDFLKGVIGYVSRITQNKGAKLLAAIGNGVLSNRDEICSAISRFTVGDWLNLDKEENFNGYDITTMMVQEINVSQGSAIIASSAVVENDDFVLSEFDADKGGIAFNALPIQTESVASSALGALSGARAFMGDLDAEWGRIQDVFNAGIRPSIQRLSEYTAAVVASPLAEDKIDQVRVMLADILRRDEESEKLAPAEGSCKQLLMALEAG